MFFELAGNGDMFETPVPVVMRDTKSWWTWGVCLD